MHGPNMHLLLLLEFFGLGFFLTVDVNLNVCSKDLLLRA